jgi:hypothetical protein
MREEKLQIRKLWLGKLLKRSGDGIILNEHEAGDIGRERGYKAGPCNHWIKVKPEVDCNASRQGS